MNILILASDSLRSDHISFNGYHRLTSPNIDSLAENSITFRQCMTPIGSTLESMTGLMSSQYPHTHGLRNMFPTAAEVEAVNRNSPALAEILSQNGYETLVLGDWCAAIFNEVPLGFQDIEVAPFDSFRIWLSEAVYLSHPVVPMYFDNEFGYWLFPKLKSFAHYLRPEVVTERAMAKLDEQKRKGSPFFMTVFCGTNHFAYHAPYPYYQKWSDENYNGPNKFQVKFDINAFTTRTDWNQDYAKLDAVERQHVIDLYDGCVSQFDDCVGRVIERLKHNGQLENTIVIITSDHGEDLFDPGSTLCHGVSFNGGDQGNRVPAVVYVPGQEPKVIERIVRNIDVAPTLLELVGLRKPATFEGRSLVPYVQGGDADLGLAYFGETSYPFYRRSLPDGFASVDIPAFDKMTFVDKENEYHIVLKDKFNEPVNLSKERCLRTEDFKLVFTPGEDGPVHRLYDVKVDPHCQEDVQREHPEMYRRMKWHLWQWILHQKEATISEIEGGPVPADFRVPDEYTKIDW
jgi:arylsulfatase A-like enzyme